MIIQTIIIIFIMWISYVYSQFVFSPMTGFQNKTYHYGLADSFTRDSGTNAYVSAKDSNGKYKIIHWDLTNSSNFYNAGNYTYGNQASFYFDIYFVNGYILACENSGSPKLYNQTTYAYISNLTTTDILKRGHFIASSNIFVYGTSTGAIGYFSVNNIPIVNVTYLTPSFTSVAFIAVSPDQKYFAASSANSNIILFWRISDWSLVAQATANTAGVYGHVWSSDSRYCYSNLYNQGKIEVYDRNLNFAKIYTIVTNQLNVKSTFYYPQTNIIVGLSIATNSLFSVNIGNNITTHYLYNFSIAYKMYVDNQMKSFTVQDALTKVYFFKISPYCNGTTFYNKLTLVCENCPINCLTCNSSIYCITCNASFDNANGSCLQCSTGTYFNSTNLACDSCSINCSACINLTYCTICNVNFDNSFGVCINCLSNQYFNQATQTCQNCSNNCLSCTNYSLCIQCSNLYNLVGGNCIICQSNQYFNTSSLSCQLCEPNCFQCSNYSSCLICDTNFLLVNENCELITNNQKIDQNFRKIFSATFQNDILLVSNMLPGSRRILKPIFGFFLNLDHLWLYIYHKREYGYYVNTTLYGIKYLQDSKWNMISSETLTKTFSLNISDLQNQFTSKTNYTSWKFMEVQKNQISFFGNTLNFFILNIPLVFITFLLMKSLFKLFFNYQVSLLFREYSFYTCLLLMFTEGNIESFSYLFTSELFTFFSFSYFGKIQQILTIVFFFFFIFAIFANYLIFKSILKKLTKYVYDNCNSILLGAFYLTISNGVLNFCLGSVHRIFQDSYKLQLFVLSIIQICYMGFIVIFLSKFKIFELYYIQWVNFIASFLRILLLITFIIDYNSPGKYQQVQYAQKNIMMLYIQIWMIVVMLNYCLLVLKFLIYLMRIYKNTQKYQLKNQMINILKNATIMQQQPIKKTKYRIIQILPGIIQNQIILNQKTDQNKTIKGQLSANIIQSQFEKNQNNKILVRSKLKRKINKYKNKNSNVLKIIHKQNYKFSIFKQAKLVDIANQ